MSPCTREETEVPEWQRLFTHRHSFYVVPKSLFTLRSFDSIAFIHKVYTVYYYHQYQHHHHPSSEIFFFFFLVYIFLFLLRSHCHKNVTLRLGVAVTPVNLALERWRQDQEFKVRDLTT